MKRIGNLYEKIYDWDNLKEAHRRARKDKTFYKEVRMVDSNPDYYLSQIQEMLKNETYKVSDYTFSIIRDKGKERELAKLPYYPDRIIQWAIMLQVESVFLNTFCTHTCSSIPKRGIHRAYDLILRALKDKPNTKYCLKLDVAKFYPSVNHDILKALLRKKFKDDKLLRLFDNIIDSYPKSVGIPIGSYLSQYLANFYLCYFDHWLKETKHVKHVVRFADDIVIFGDSKSTLHQLMDDIREYMHDNLSLNVKANWQVFPTDVRGVDFLSYRFFRNYILLRKSTCIRFKRQMRRIRAKQERKELISYSEWCSANSYIGWLKWANTWRLFTKYITPITKSLTAYYYVKRYPTTHQIKRYFNKLNQMKGRVIIC